jgi:hypothetical protein
MLVEQIHKKVESLIELDLEQMGTKPARVEKGMVHNNDNREKNYSHLYAKL